VRGRSFEDKREKREGTVHAKEKEEKNTLQKVPASNEAFWDFL
jgi:hypothetical protein